ncbi:MAG: uracil-DNA glycosylase [Betaproteobacteria bacterium]|nr:MAG: uracil-DNA glycosylase [Betaproteobacteria bacterium]
MSSRRELFLEEMGLTPLWRLRRGEAIGDSAAAQPQNLTAATGEAETSQPLSLRSVQDAEGRATRIARMDWDDLKETAAACTACGLRKTCTQTVFGVGDEKADWLIVGEAPGAEEDARGEPFVGQAGKLLDAMLAAIGLKRGEDVYIANVLKCRPPGNRNPEAAEVAQCSPFLLRQVELIQPRMILALGRFACQTLLETDASIASLRGQVHRYQGVPLIVTYHPAYLLRSLPDKAKAWEDLCFARRTMVALRG